jgi:phosphoglycolate phosphatase-like HAD superfamily hydrolase
MRLVLIDLDGPVLDVRERYFACHRCATHGLKAPALDRDAYWEAKRRRVPVAELLGVPEASEEAERYRERWLAAIESDELLRLDTVQPGAREALVRLAAVPARVVVSLRTNAAGAHATLERLDLAGRFTGIELVPHAAGSKEPVFRAHAAGVDPREVAVVGDTEHDVLPARALGLRAIAVGCGIRTPAYLASLGASAVVATLADAAELLLGAAAPDARALVRGDAS